jgi:1-deoxy-D-xylulose 5-phosphate reductoisomerase
MEYHAIKILYFFMSKLNNIHPKVAVITDRISYNNFTKEYGNKVDSTRILFGDDGLSAIISDSKVTTVIAAVVGFRMH